MAKKTETLEKKSGMMRFLDGVEKIGNKMPNPATLFLILTALVMIISAICARMGVSVTYETVNTANGNAVEEVTVSAVKDGPKKLAARRAIMAKTYDLQEIKGFNEKKSEFKARTADVQHPLMDKVFNEIAPKYAARKEELGQGGGYTRIYLLGERRGDGAEMAIIELV